MSTAPVTVQEAVSRGEKVIALPSRIILFSTIILCMLLLMLHFSWWHFLLLPAGMLASVFYTMYVTPRWKSWAYEHVSDIHQLQRTAELAGLLTVQSYNNTGGFMSRRQRQTIKALQRKFSEKPVFVDDPSISDETPVYKKGLFSVSKEPVIILNDFGIQVPSAGFFEWGQIADERIVRMSFNRISPKTGTKVSGGSKDFFRFEVPPRRFEIPLSLLNIAVWKLDLLLYIYRGRFAVKQKRSI